MRVVAVLVVAMLGGCAGGGAPDAPRDEARHVGQDVVDLGGLGAVAGRVTDEANRSIAGALIVPVDADQSALTTGRDGAFRFEGLQPGPAKLHVKADGYKVRLMEFTVVADRVVHLEIPLYPLESVGAAYRLHVHDYWGGQDTYLFMDEAFVLTKKPEGEGINPVLFHAYTGICNANANGTCSGTRWIPLPEGEPGHPAIVIPGTGAIEVTLGWDETELQTSSLGLGYIPPDAEEAVLMAPRDNGGTWNIPVDADTADSGHQDWTFWRFFLYFPNDVTQPTSWEPVVAVEPEVHSHILLRRSLEPYLEPAHPTFWNGSDELVLLDGALDVNRISLGSPGGDAIQVASLPEGTLVPPGTSRMVIAFSWESPAPYEHRLRWRTADQNPHTTGVDDFATGDAASCGDRCIQYEIDVDGGSADKVYQKKSGWAFFPYPEPFWETKVWWEVQTQYAAKITVFKDPSYEEPAAL